MKWGQVSLLILLFFLGISLAQAHHSRTNFLLDKTVEFEGVVKRFSYTNPHVYLYVDTIDSNDEPIEVAIELGSIPQMGRLGMAKDSFTPGDKVTLIANPDRNPKKALALFHTIKKQDGFEVSMEGIFAYGRKVRNASDGKPGSQNFSGIWSIVKSKKDIFAAARQTPTTQLTERGKKQLAAYDPNENPFYQCIPEGLPRRVGSVYPMIIQREGDVIFIRDEISPNRRTIYLNAAKPDKPIKPSSLGYSVGRIEDDELIVETDHFIAEKWGIAPGVDSSSQKTLVERYWLSDDGRQLNVEATVMDPVYLTKPFTMRYRWKYAPDMIISDYIECDPEAAAKHLLLDG